MPQQSAGLYYPYIHFRDESWLKRAALYWDKMARIVPEADDVNAEDTDLVRALKFEAGFIEDIRPNSQTNIVGKRFLKLLRAYEPELRSTYGFAKWKHRLIGSGAYKRRRPGDPVINEVYTEKMSSTLREGLVETQLAYAPPYGDFLVMHRQLAGVYMTVLADAMAGMQYQPTTDNIQNHFAVMGGNLQHIKQALLPTRSKRNESAKSHLHAPGIAMFALQIAVPKNMGAISVKDILKFRKQYKSEVTEFREEVVAFAQDHEILGSLIDRPRDLQGALENAYHKKVERKLSELDTIMSKVWRETALAMIYVSPMAVVGKAIPEWAGDVERASATIAAVALGTIPVLRQKRRELKSQFGATAYILHAQECFGRKATSTRRLKAWSRKSFFRI